MKFQVAMLTEINAAVVVGDVVVESEARDYIQWCTDRIVGGDESGWHDFIRYLRDHQPLARVVGRRLVRAGYRFLDEEMERLQQIKAERSLNHEERDYGLRILTQLLDSITSLACKTGDAGE